MAAGSVVEIAAAYYITEPKKWQRKKYLLYLNNFAHTKDVKGVSEANCKHCQKILPDTRLLPTSFCHPSVLLVGKSVETM